jgi:two-component system, NtrC family, sensor histidine kinase PilS
MPGSFGERRRSDRRTGASAQMGGRRRDDALFATTLDADSQGSAFIDPGWLAAGDIAPDDQRLLRQVRRFAAAQDSALARVFRTYAAARAAIGVGLVLVQGLGSALGMRSLEAMAWVALAYAAQAITLWLLPRYRELAQPQPRGRRRQQQWLATIGVDLVAFTALHVMAVGSSFNYAALLVLPVLMAGVLTSRLVSLGTAAAVALMLLLVALNAAQDGGAVPELLLQSGLAGLGFFIITLLSGELAGRLAREELAARGSLELARQQAQLNRLVIEEMADGVLVVDRKLRVRAANPAARALLVDQGLAPPSPFGLGDQPAWEPLSQCVAQAFSHGEWPEAGLDVTLGFEAGYSRTLRMRVRFMQRRDLETPRPESGAADSPRRDTAREPADEKAPADEPFLVLLLEDVRTALARVRQEKLAAMGRVSAGVAHEIRNPLAAIAQANALLQEDDLNPTQQRLAAIVADNVQRLKRLVDDVMEVAPGLAPVLHAIDITAVTANVVREWAATHQLPLGVLASGAPNGALNGAGNGFANGAAKSAAAGTTAGTAYGPAAGVSHRNTEGIHFGVAADLTDERQTSLVAPLAADLCRLQVAWPGEAVHGYFDAEHLRRVLVNLLDNAHRHATAHAGAIQLRLAVQDEQRLLLTVGSDGEAIAPDVQRHLFEPFFSTRSRGTGLGLYICRELCERYGAAMEFNALSAAERLRNQFAVSLRRAPAPSGGGVGSAGPPA